MKPRYQKQNAILRFCLWAALALGIFGAAYSLAVDISAVKEGAREVLRIQKLDYLYGTVTLARANGEERKIKWRTPLFSGATIQQGSSIAATCLEHRCVPEYPSYWVEHAGRLVFLLAVGIFLFRIRRRIN